MRHCGAVTDPVVLFGPPATLAEGDVVVRVVAAYAVATAVAVVVDAIGLPRPDPERRPDPVIEGVDLVRRDGTKSPCRTIGGVSSAGSQHSMAWSQWLATETPERLELAVRTPAGLTTVRLSVVDLGGM